MKRNGPQFLRWFASTVAGLGLVSVALNAADFIAENVRSTPKRSPEEERQMFHLPPGFEIQLVAAEPDINKPMNLAFDAAGRLWVTTSLEYPYAAPTNRPARDRLMILEDFGPDGRARKITQFADGLNIPIGIYPFSSPPTAKSKTRNSEPGTRNSEPGTRNPEPGTRNSEPGTWKAIVWSIPNIWLFEDTDGDGKADKRVVLYGPFDATRDTHGDQASFRRGFDGWLYCTHGYNNDSHVKGRDGQQVDLNSGNTYRLRLDGSRIEQYTHGQVNPFGLAFDELGNLFASDCHSEPIYQLLAGGYYPSFGKPHDGLGFAPKMMEKPRGSTALDGISIYSDDLWPPEFYGNIFLGDVMASRVYRDRVTEEGSTRTARPMPDLVIADDPWFRPVDTMLGPDGALYIADFYNRIIGHYEVPLAHPGRDRTSGRIWRVVYKDKPLRPAALASDLKGLVKELASPNLPRRMLAMNSIVDRFGQGAVKEVETAAAMPANPEQHVQALWLLHRLESSKPDDLTAAARSRNRLVRVHAQRIAGDIFQQDSQGHLGSDVETDNDHLATAMQITADGLKDRDALVQRCAAEAGAYHEAQGGGYFAQLLLALRARVPTNDTHLLYVVRKSLRDQLRVRGVFEKVLEEPLSEPEVRTLADVSLGVTNAAAATFLLRQLPELSKAKNPSPPVADILKHAARYAPESELDQLASFARARIPAAFGLEQYQEIERQFGLFKSVDEGLQQRGRARPEAIRAWGTNLVWRFFGALDGYHSWTATPYEPNPTDVPWDVETRTGSDGRKRQLTSSLPHGEDLTGVLRSPDFPLPSKLTFWLCGHDGFPEKPAGHLNSIRLRLRETGEVLASVAAPRNDTARRITWELPQHDGRRVFVEAVDGDDGRAYAWIAFGGFEPELPQLRPSEFSPRKMRDWIAAATEAAVGLKMKEAAPVFAHFISPQRDLRVDETDAEVFAGFARAWVALEPSRAVPVLAGALTNGYGPVAYREGVAGVLAAQNSSAAQDAVLAATKSLPLKSQEKICFPLASTKFGAETLLTGLEGGAISPQVLQRVGVNNRLKSSKPSDWEARLKKLTAKLPPPDDARNKLIADRRAACSTAPGKVESGKLVFAKICGACHSIERVGGNVGPQLDGIGQRGLERLCEDVLDPNRNVDRAFRSTLFTLKDGDVVSGLFRREEGELLVLADSTGKEISLPKSNVTERRESETSLMPENFGEILSAEDFKDLMAYLLWTGQTAAHR